MYWKDNFVINPHDEDINGIVGASAILRYFQSAAYNYHKAYPPSIKDMAAAGIGFILSKCAISFYAPVYAYDDVMVKTWDSHSRGPVFNRSYAMYRGELPVAEMTSSWALLSFADRKLLRVEESGLPYEPETALELDLPKRVRVPDDVTLAIRGEHIVTYSDCDTNGHMNNTRYPDFLCDFLPDMRGKRVISIVLSFMNEAPLGDTIRVYSGSNDDKVWFRTQRGDGLTGVEAEIMLDDIC